jgi:protein-disulfide isomerase
MSEKNQKTNETTGFATKDLFIPISIVIAGVAVGAGLYFSGSPSASSPKAPADPLMTIAKSIGLDTRKFTACLDSNETASLVEADASNATATGGNGTPWSIVIGPSGKKYPMNGALPVEMVEELIELARTDGPLPEGANAELLENMIPVSEDDHIKGNIDAEVIIVEYSDYDCTFCARFYDTMKIITEKYPADKVAWVYRHLPLEMIHPNAKRVAMASECAAKQGGNDAFWAFSDQYNK